MHIEDFIGERITGWAVEWYLHDEDRRPWLFLSIDDNEASEVVVIVDRRVRQLRPHRTAPNAYVVPSLDMLRAVAEAVRVSQLDPLERLAEI